MNKLAVLCASLFLLLNTAVAAPTLSIGKPALLKRLPPSLLYAVTYEGASRILLTKDLVTVHRTGTANGTLSVENNAGTSTVMIADVTGEGSLSISIAAGSAEDASGEPAPASGLSDAWVFGNPPASITLSPPSDFLTRNGPVKYEIDFVNTPRITLTPDNLTLVKTGTANAVLRLSELSNQHRTVEVFDIRGDGTLGIFLGAGTAVNGNGEAIAAAGASVTFKVDNTQPTSGSVSGANPR